MAHLATDVGGSGDTPISPENVELKEKLPKKITTGGGAPVKEFVEVPLEGGGKKKLPRRVLHFSDGTLEEYSTDEEEERKKVKKPDPVDPKTLTWMPYIRHYLMNVAVGTLSFCDYLGESLASFFGITTPKYQYAIDEYHRNLEEEKEEKEREEREIASAAARKVASDTVDAAKMESGNADGGKSPERRNAKQEDKDVKKKIAEPPVAIKQSATLESKCGPISAK